MKRKICVVTGTRAEYGLLSPLIKKIQQEKELQLQLLVTGMHLSTEFGNTYKQIEQDGLIIDEKVEILLSADTATGVVKSLGLATIGFSDAFARLQPDLVVILGDRFEMLAVAQTALIMQIPIAHIAGGECTFGAYDDAIRHAITKMATWHFVSTEEHKNRVIQLGESPSRIWNVGAIGIENIMNMQLLSRKNLFKELFIINKKDYFLITIHPETHSDVYKIDDILSALREFRGYTLIFTKANADNGGRFINNKIEEFIKEGIDAYLFDSLGQLKYLSAAKHAKVVVGNSSSSLIEVPYLKTPSVNIGMRQKGRQKPNSVIDCRNNREEIITSIHSALNYNGEFEEKFGDGKTSEKIIKIIQSIDNFKIVKEFHNL